MTIYTFIITGPGTPSRFGAILAESATDAQREATTFAKQQPWPAAAKVHQVDDDQVLIAAAAILRRLNYPQVAETLTRIADHFYPVEA